MVELYFDIAFPQRRIMSTNDMDAYYKLVNRYNGKRPIYRSLYYFEKEEDNRVVPNSAIIDKMHLNKCPNYMCGSMKGIMHIR